MSEAIHNRRSFLSAAGAVVAASATPLLAVSTDVRAGAEEFLNAWMTAWNKRDSHALAALHTVDCVTVNRFGTLIPDRKSAEEALVFLLGPQGPFGDTVFAPMKIVMLREVAAGVAIVQASWSAPALAPNGKMVPGASNAMLLTYTLLKQEGHWKATQIDPHNVEHMELPYSNPDQKK
jgi:hypothetical protein